MTHESLQKIINTVTCNGMRELTEEIALQAMKEAVNQAIEEAAEKTNKREYESGIHKNEILKLKLK